jgi:uncharacterized membrane protein YphA (DoxX/SURF4 family)
VNVVLWILQILIALVFLFAGGVKLVGPLDQFMKGMPSWLTPGFLRFIGVCEVAGGLGLILPRLLRIKPGLTPIAAVALIGIMIGATVVTVTGASPAQAASPVIVGCLLAFIAYGRWRLAR